MVWATEDVALQNLIHWIVSQCIVIVVVFGGAAARKFIMFQFLFVGQADLILCARCFVRGNYQLGLNSGDFKRVDISEETKTNWTEKETLHLLEAILQFGNDWKKVAEHVGGRSEKECVARFIKLPFREQFMGASDIDEVDKYYHKKDQLNAERVEISAISSPAKRRCLTPLADASNPIMAQVQISRLTFGKILTLVLLNP